MNIHDINTNMCREDVSPGCEPAGMPSPPPESAILDEPTIATVFEIQKKVHMHMCR